MASDCADRHQVQAVQRPQISGDGCRPFCHNRMLRLAAARREATLLCPLHHCPAPAAKQRQPATRPPLMMGLEMNPDLHRFSCRFHRMSYRMAYSMAYSMLRGIATSHFSVVYSRGAILHTCYITGSPHYTFQCYIPQDKLYVTPAI